MTAIFNTIQSNIGLSFSILSLIVLIQIIFIIIYFIKFKALKKIYNHFIKGSEIANIEDVLIFLKNSDKDNKEKILEHEKIIDDILSQMQISIDKVVLHKYDAFEDMGGQLSSVLIIVNKQYTGILINIIHNKEGCYIYTKSIVQGTASVTLSKEEQVALKKMQV